MISFLISGAIRHQIQEDRENGARGKILAKALFTSEPVSAIAGANANGGAEQQPEDCENGCFPLVFGGLFDHRDELFHGNFLSFC